MSLDNGSYVLRTPARNSLGFEFRAAHAMAIEHITLPDSGLRNSYLLRSFGSSWAFARERRAVAMARLIEEEIPSYSTFGLGTEYGVSVVEMTGSFPGADTERRLFGKGDGVYVLKSKSAWRDGGFDYHVVYSTEPVQQAAFNLNEGALDTLAASARLITGVFGWRQSASFGCRSRAKRAAQLIHDDIVARGGRTEHGVVVLEIGQQLPL